MKIGDYCSFYVDLDYLTGEIIEINGKLLDVLTDVGLIKDIPMSEIVVELNYQLRFCETCFQMTNHLDDICQKHNKK